MSGNLSATFEISQVDLTSMQQVFRSRSLSGKRSARLGGYQLWKLRVTFNPMTPAESASLRGFLIDQRGGYETFTFTPPGLANPAGNWGVITVSSVIDDTTLVMTGFGTNDANAVKAGDVFTVAGSTKVYMVTSDASSDGSNNATVSFQPALVDTPTGGESVTHTSVSFTVELDQNEISFSRSGFYYNSFTIDLVEALA